MTDKKENVESSMNGNSHGYRVQARVADISDIRPIMFSQPHYPNRQLLLTDKWTDIHPYEGLNPAGVPVASDDFVRSASLLPRKSAIALAYTFAAQHSNGRFDGVQIRVVKYHVQYSLEYGPTDEIISLDDHLYEFEKKSIDEKEKGKLPLVEVPNTLTPRIKLKDILHKEWEEKYPKLTWIQFYKSKKAQNIIKDFVDRDVS